MDASVQKPFLITFTASACSGKSYLLSYIRDVAKLPCFVSTTTRPSREGEVQGVDYDFITDEESRAIEARDGFAELVTFRGYRYGVTKEEFRNKLHSGAGVAFLIVEPEGIDHYVKPALEAGANWLKVYIDIEQEVQVERFKKRMEADVLKAIKDMHVADSSSLQGDNSEIVLRVIRNYSNRLISLVGPESKWKDMHVWDMILRGDEHPEENLRKILLRVEAERAASRHAKMKRDSQLTQTRFPNE